MTAINENGQVYWTFEELDFDGALDSLLNTLRFSQDRIEEYSNDALCADTHTMREIFKGHAEMYQKRFDKLIKVCLYLERLKRGQNYA